MIKFKHLLLFSLLCVSPYFLKAQYSSLALSEKSEYIAFADKIHQIKDTILVRKDSSFVTETINLYDLPIYIYKNRNGKYIKTIHLKTPEKPKIGKAGFSTNNNIFFLQHDNKYKFWNIPAGKSLKSVEAQSIVISNQYDSFYALKDNSIIKHSFYYNTTDTFKIKNGIKIKKFNITSDDKFLIALGNNDKVYIWRHGLDKSEVKKLSAYDFTVDKKGNFYIVRIKKGVFSLKIYNSKINNADFDRQRSVSAKKFIGKSKVFKSKVLPEESFFTSSGDIYVLVWKKLSKKYFSFIYTHKRKEKLKLRQKSNEYSRPEPYFYSDTICFLRKDKRTIEAYDLYSGKKLAVLESDKRVEYKNLLFDKDFVRIEQQGNEIVVSDGKNNNKKYPNCSNLSLSKYGNSNFVIQNNKSEISYSPIETIFGNDSNQYFEPIPKNEIEKYRKGLEITNIDTVSYTKIQELKNISNSYRSKLFMEAKAIEIKDEYTGLQFYLVDSLRNYYYGAASEKWHEIFCEVTVENEYGEIEVLDDFKIRETNEQNSPPFSVCFVLDHSGSINVEDANIMQSSLLKLSKEKSGKDGFGLIKFDGKVKREIALTELMSVLQDSIKVVGLKGYGGSTALLGGINEGLEMLAENNKYSHKALIVLTDGYENASKVTRNQVLKKAIENNIAVYTIGMGATVDVEFLRSLSTHTNGGYYWISDNEKLDDVFGDIYKNMKNFYTLRFNTPYPGKYKLTLKLCNDDYEDELEYYFNNYIPDMLYTFDEFEADSMFREITGLKDTLYLDDFNTNRIYEDMEFRKLKKEFDALIFPDIKFDYNKTSIVENTDKELIDVIGFMKRNPSCRIEIQGHTDNRGALLYNETLSQGRAEKVKTIMTDTGILSQRIRTRGYGETKPIAPNYTKEGRQKNRRVEFLLVRP